MLEKDSNSQLWVIIGSYESNEYGYGGWTGHSDWVEEKVATFDTKKMAIDYIKKSKLKNPKDKRHPFKLKSLLSGYKYAEAEVYVEEAPPHNPTL